MRCNRCGRYTTKVIVRGSTLVCPACAVSDPAARATAVHGDEMDHWQVNGTNQPIHFTSKADHRAWVTANGYEIRDHFVATPGSDKAQNGNTNSARYIDPVTMENARVLVERCGVRVPTAEDPLIHFTPDIHDLTAEEFAKYAGR